MSATQQQPPPPDAKADRPWYKKKRWIAGIILLIVIVAAGANGSGDSDDADTSSDDPTEASSTEDTTADAEKAKAADEPEAPAEPKPEAVKVSAETILADYESNELSADKKYKGKQIEVTGTIDNIDTELFNEDKYVLRISNGEQFSFLTVNCNDMSEKVLSSLTVGDEVTVTGKFDDGGDLGVELKKCELA